MKVKGKDYKFGNLRLVNFINLSSREKEMIRRWRNHKEVSRWMCSKKNISLREHSLFLKKLKSDSSSHYWLGSYRGDEYLGVVYLNKIDYFNRHAYLGIYTNPETPVKGRGRLLMDCLKKITFKRLKLHTLKLEVEQDNLRAIKFYKMAGFKLEGRLKGFVLKNGKWLDLIIMGLARRAYGV